MANGSGEAVTTAVAEGESVEADATAVAEGSTEAGGIDASTPVQPMTIPTTIDAMAARAATGLATGLGLMVPSVFQ